MKPEADFKYRHYPWIVTIIAVFVLFRVLSPKSVVVPGKRYNYSRITKIELINRGLTTNNADKVITDRHSIDQFRRLYKQSRRIKFNDIKNPKGGSGACDVRVCFEKKDADKFYLVNYKIEGGVIRYIGWDDNVFLNDSLLQFTINQLKQPQ